MTWGGGYPGQQLEEENERLKTELARVRDNLEVAELAIELQEPVVKMLQRQLARVKAERDRLFDIVVEDDQRASRSRGHFRPLSDSVGRMILVLSRPHIFANPVAYTLAEHDRKATGATSPYTSPPQPPRTPPAPPHS